MSGEYRVDHQGVDGSLYRVHSGNLGLLLAQGRRESGMRRKLPVLWACVVCLLAGELGLCTSAPAAETSQNGNGVKITGVTTQHIGLKSSQQSSGKRATVGVSSNVSRVSQTTSGCKVVVGPGAVVRKVQVASLRNWSYYR